MYKYTDIQYQFHISNFVSQIEVKLNEINCKTNLINCQIKFAFHFIVRNNTYTGIDLVLF